MAETLKIAIWNANGLCQHTQEITYFLQLNKIDVMLISEAHYTEKSHIKIPKYCIYYTTHPSGRAHGGTAVIIRQNINHYELEKYQQDYLQATNIAIKDHIGTLTVSAIYCPPKHNNKLEQYEHYFKTLGNRFIAGGDYNAKNPEWGSRTTTTKGRELLATMKKNNLRCLATGEPTYWPTDPNKIPDAIDFGITKGINVKQCKTEPSLDLSSDHSAVLITMYTKIIHKQRQPTLFSKHTDWDKFRLYLDELIDLHMPLKSEEELNEAVDRITKGLQQAAWKATPDYTATKIPEVYPISIKEKIAVKRKLRKRWQVTRLETDKRKFNNATRDLKRMILELKNQNIQEYLNHLSPYEATDYSLWKATRKIKRPPEPIPPIRNENGKWARNDKEKALVFAKHLEGVFKPFPSK